MAGGREPSPPTADPARTWPARCGLTVRFDEVARPAALARNFFRRWS
jgi:hypothetical protein